MEGAFSRYGPLHHVSNHYNAFPVGGQRVGRGFPVWRANFPSFDNREVWPKMLKFVHKFRQFRQTVAVFTDIPVYFPVYREFGIGDGFAHDCAHHQAFQELSYFADAKPSRGLHHGLQFWSLFELQRRCLSELNVATEIVRIKDSLERYGCSKTWCRRERRRSRIVMIAFRTLPNHYLGTT
jgi:hypothetical protein